MALAKNSYIWLLSPKKERVIIQVKKILDEKGGPGPPCPPAGAPLMVNRSIGLFILQQK